MENPKEKNTIDMELDVKVKKISQLQVEFFEVLGLEERQQIFKEYTTLVNDLTLLENPEKIFVGDINIDEFIYDCISEAKIMKNSFDAPASGQGDDDINMLLEMVYNGQLAEVDFDSITGQDLCKKNAMEQYIMKDISDKNILIFGEKGTGKTNFVQACARQKGSHLFIVPVEQLLDQWKNSGVELIDAMESLSKKAKEPTSILFDDFDKLYSDEKNRNCLKTLLIIDRITEILVDNSN